MLVEQAHRQQRTQQAAIGNIQRWGKPGGHGSEFANAGGETVFHIRRRHAHRGNTIGSATRALLLVVSVTPGVFCRLVQTPCALGHRGTATLARPIERFRSLWPVALHRPLEADLCHPQGLGDFCLRRHCR